MTNTSKKVINVQFNNAEDNTNLTRCLDVKLVECTMTDDTGKTVTTCHHTREEAAEAARKSLGITD